MILHNNMKISQKGIDIIKEFEGFEPKVYLCSAGKPTIGYGYRITPTQYIDHTITEENALKLLKHTLVKIEDYVNSAVTVKISQGQFDALCSLVYNWRTSSFGRSKGLKALNSSQFDVATIEFFSKEKGVVNVLGKFSSGLYRRRQAELKLWRED